MRTPSTIPEMTIMKRSVMTVAPIDPFDTELKKKVTDRTLPAYRRHSPNDSAVSIGTLPYIAKSEIETITYPKTMSNITAAQLARYFPITSVVRFTGRCAGTVTLRSSSPARFCKRI
jgi:hypothetical protein